MSDYAPSIATSILYGTDGHKVFLQTFTKGLLLAEEVVPSSKEVDFVGLGVN
jgi:hypothetical protein